MTDAIPTLRGLIRDIPDFPKPGIIFKDITPLLGDAAGLAMAVEVMANPFRQDRVDLVVGAESRGFIFGTAICGSSSGAHASFVWFRWKRNFSGIRFRHGIRCSGQ